MFTFLKPLTPRLKNVRINLMGIYIALGLILLSLLISISGINKFPGIKPASASGVPATWQKGITLYPQSATDFASANTDLVIQDVKDMGGNYITLIIPLQQDYWTSSTIYKAPFAPDDASLIHAINKAHSLGLKVSLKPHVDPKDNVWRAQIEPDDRNAWYTNYSTFLYYYADLAQQNGVEQLVVGSELISMAAYTTTSSDTIPDNTNRWKTMISQVRQRYSGLLTYSANWGGSYFSAEVDHIAFWGDLDFIGISAYYSLSAYTNPGIDYLMGSWNTINNNDITPVHLKYNKPVLFTEIGYRSVDGATINPWDWQLQGPYDPEEQADAIKVMLQYWSNSTYNWFAGFQYWNWETNPGCSGSEDKSYTLQNKPAYYTMKYGLASQTPLPFNVTATVDNGASSDCNTLGTLSYALQRAGTGDVINLMPGNSNKLLQVKGQLPTVNQGVKIIGSDCSGATPVTINGADLSASGDGLYLKDNVFLQGLTITGFKDRQVIIGGLGIKMSCVKIAKT